MYPYEDRLRGLKLYIKHGGRSTTVIWELGLSRGFTST